MTNIRFPHTLADLKPGNHLCCLYETEEEHRTVLTLFLRQGLEQGEKVLCIVDSVLATAPRTDWPTKGSARSAEWAGQSRVDDHTAETVLSYLRDDGLDVEPYLARRQLAFRTHDETYMREGVFNPDNMIALLRAETEQALIKGYPALRLTDEMNWVLQGLPGSERLIEYEARLNDFLPGAQCLILYRYDRRRFDTRVLLDVLRAHPVAMVGTEVYDNPYYIPPTELLSDSSLAELRHWIQNLAERKRMDEALRKQTRDLDERVKERTREIERRRQVAESLRAILAVLNSNRSLNTVLDYILVQASQLLGADAVAIYRLEREGELLSIQAARGLDRDYVTDAIIPVGQSVTGQAVFKDQPVMLSDVAAVSSDDDLSLDLQRQTLLERLGSHYRALLAVPLKNDETFGAITLYYHEPREFSDEEIRLAVTFGDQVALAIQNAQLRAQVERSAVAAERSRLARDLHDSVTQILFAASLTAEVLPIVWERHRGEGLQALEELRQLTRGALAEMRTLLLELRPAALMKASLNDLLRQLAEAVIGRARVPVTLKIEGLRPLPPDVKVALYRIAQEALNNVAKHAGASHASVSLRYAPPAPQGAGRGVELYISDDGCGFDVDQVSPDHLGLSIMRERTEEIGATLTIESQPGHGTQVMATWQDA